MSKGNLHFFDEQTPSSRIKANIVASYFRPYCRIIDTYDQQGEIRYIDLFSGPGLYKDGNPSTPFLIADQIADDPKLASKVRFLFNDNKYAEELESNFSLRYSENTFKKKPSFGNKTVGENDKIDKYLETSHVDVNGKNRFPTLLFIDPFGYKGINPKVLSKFMNDWGNEIFLFVNIKRIHAAVANNKFDQLMEILFPSSIDQIRDERRYKAHPSERLNLIMEKLGDEFRNLLGKDLHITSFKFQEEDSIATSHYLMHLTKHAKGYELIKQTYNDFDNIGAELEKDGTYTFDAKKMDIPDGMLQFEDANVATLSNILYQKYKNCTKLVTDIFNEHHPTSLYCGTHYVKALRKLVEQGKAEAWFTDDINHKKSVIMTDSCQIKIG